MHKFSLLAAIKWVVNMFLFKFFPFPRNLSGTWTNKEERRAGCE